MPHRPRCWRWPINRAGNRVLAVWVALIGFDLTTKALQEVEASASELRRREFVRSSGVVRVRAVKLGGMNTYVALLRAVNVGGTGKLPMAELKAMCTAAGFAQVRTYIASGNVVLASAQSAGQVKAALEAQLARYAGKPVGVLVRSGAELAQVLAANPFPQAAPNRTVAIFLDAAPPADTLATLKHRNGEEIVLGQREIYVHYGDGMADSKLVIPAARHGTARNMNTVAKLVEMAASA